MPKKYQYSLGQDLICLVWQCLDLVLEANALSGDQKKKKILKLSCLFDKFKLRIRMAQEIKIITIKQFTNLQINYLEEIGKMIGGWVKWLEGRRL